MNRLFTIFTWLLAAAFPVQAAVAAPTRSGLAAPVCATCPSPLSALKFVATHPARVEAGFRKLHKVLAPGARTDAEITKLGRQYAKLDGQWYLFLKNPHFKPDQALLHRVLSDSKFDRATRGGPSLMLYALTKRVRYGVLTLRLLPFFAKQLSVAKDPQFAAVLARLISERLARTARSPFGLPDVASATAALRVEYAYLCADAVFQKAPPRLRKMLFSLYAGLKPGATGRFGQWQVEGMRIWPFGAPAVIKRLRGFGSKYEAEFIGSLAHHGCARDLHEIIRAYPGLAPVVLSAIRQEAARAGQEVKGLKPGKKAGPPGKGPGPASSRPAAMPSQQPAEVQTIDLGLLPPGGSVSRRITIPNHSKGAVSVTQVVPSCGCTQASVTRPSIPPGSVTTLVAHVLIHPWVGPAKIGVLLLGTKAGKPWGRDVRILYRTQRVLRVILKGREALQIDGHLDLGRFPLADGAPKLPKLNLERGGYPATWDRLQCRASGLLAPDLQKMADGNWTLALLQSGTHYIGRQSCDLNFSFFNHGKPLPYTVSVPTVFRISGPVDIAPESISFGVLKEGAKATRNVSVREEPATHDSAGFTVISASPSDNDAPVTARVVNDGRTVVVRLDTSGLSGRVNGYVIITASGAGRAYRFREDYSAYVIGKVLAAK